MECMIGVMSWTGLIKMGDVTVVVAAAAAAAAAALNNIEAKITKLML